MQAVLYLTSSLFLGVRRNIVLYIIYMYKDCNATDVFHVIFWYLLIQLAWTEPKVYPKWQQWYPHLGNNVSKIQRPDLLLMRYLV